jgi:hypothetical protein
MLFKNSVRTSKRTPHFTITKINWLTLFKEIIAVYSENHAEPIHTKRSITDCQSRWFIYLPLSLKGLIEKEVVLLNLLKFRNEGRILIFNENNLFPKRKQ